MKKTGICQLADSNYYENAKIASILLITNNIDFLPLRKTKI